MLLLPSVMELDDDDDEAVAVEAVEEGFTAGVVVLVGRCKG